MCALLTVLKWKLLMTVGRSTECAMNKGSLAKQFKGLHVARGEVGVRPTAVMIKCPQRPTSTTASLTSLHVTVRLRSNGSSVSATRVHENLRNADILIVTFRRVVSYDSGDGDLNLAVGEPWFPAPDTTFRVLTIFWKVEPWNQDKNKSLNHAA